MPQVLHFQVGHGHIAYLPSCGVGNAFCMPRPATGRIAYSRLLGEFSKALKIPTNELSEYEAVVFFLCGHICSY